MDIVKPHKDLQPLKSASGPVRYFRFKPQQPEEFVEACKHIRSD